MIKRLGLLAVTPHSARHSFISTLQAQGVEVGLVAKLAGHKNAVVTLSHYTHAMRGGGVGAGSGVRRQRRMTPWLHPIWQLEPPANPAQFNKTLSITA